MAEVLPGIAGWAAFRDETKDFVLVRVRLHGNRLVIVEIHLRDEDGIGTDTLRRTPIGQIEASINRTEIRATIVTHLDDKPRARPVQNIFHDSFYNLTRDDWPTDAQTDEIFLSVAALQVREPHAKMKVPATRPYPRTFYEQVAETYGNLAAMGSRRPAVEIADASGVPVSTVHRWVKEARRVELLPEGQRGKLV